MNVHLNLRRDGVYVIEPDHTRVEDVFFSPTGAPPLLHDLQKIVGGFIEHVPSAVGAGIVVYCNEEGKIKRLERNHLATDWCHEFTHLDVSDFIVGPLVILCGRAAVDLED